MKICLWCGIELRGLRRWFRSCRICARALIYRDSPPGPYMSKFYARTAIIERYRKSEER